MPIASCKTTCRGRSAAPALLAIATLTSTALAQPLIRTVDAPAPWQSIGLSAVSGDGLVAGGSVAQGSNRVPITWTSEGGVALVDSDTPRAVDALNQTGSVLVSGFTFTVGTGAPAAQITRNGQNAVLRNFDNLAIETRAFGLSADGSVAVGFASKQVGSIRRGFAAIWDSNNQIQPVADLPGATSSQANGVSADGLTVVGTFVANSVGSAFKWTAQGGTQLLPTPVTFTGATASKVTTDGSILGSSFRTGTQRLTRWTSSGPELLPLIQFATGSVFIGSSADGSLIYGTSFFGGSQRRTVWLNDVPYDFASLLSGLGTDLSMWDQIETFTITGVSADGKTLVGSGLYMVAPNSYQFRPFVITGIPAPGAVSVLALAGLVARRRR